MLPPCYPRSSRSCWGRGNPWRCTANGNVSYRQSDYTQAHNYYAESLAIYWELKNKRGVASVLARFARLAKAQKQYERAALLFSASTTLRDVIGIRRPATSHANYDPEVGAIRDVLGEVLFNQAWNAGQAMTLEQAIAEAIGQDTNTSS